MTDEELSKLTGDEFVRLKLTNDEKARLKVINLEKARRRAEWSVTLQLEEQSIIEDLKTIGFLVKSVWDLVNTSDRYSEAIPV